MCPAIAPSNRSLQKAFDCVAAFGHYQALMTAATDSAETARLLGAADKVQEHGCRL